MSFYLLVFSTSLLARSLFFSLRFQWVVIHFLTVGGTATAALELREPLECDSGQLDQLCARAQLARGGQSRAPAVPAAAVRRRRRRDKHAGRGRRLRRPTLRGHRVGRNQLRSEYDS